MGRASRASTILLAALLLAVASSRTPASVAALAAAASPTLAADAIPTLAAAVESGPPGLSVGVSGSGYQAGGAYVLCLLPADQMQCGPGGSGIGSFTADPSGAIPAGTQVRVPGVLAGSYLLVATTPGSAAMVATAPFDVTAPTLSLDPQVGPGGIVVAVTGTGYAPSTAYSLCVVPSGRPACGGAGIALGDVIADGSGALPSGTTVRIPGQAEGTYDVGVLVKGASLATLIVTAPFVEISPTIALNPPSGPGGATVSVTGAGLAPGATYAFCLVAQAATSCGSAAIDLGGFTADASGAIPDGTTLAIPVGGAGEVWLGIRLEDSTALLLGSVSFSRTAGTPPPSSPPVESTSPEGPGTSPGGPEPSGNPAPTGVAAVFDLAPGGPLVLVLAAAAVVAVLAGLVLSRRRSARR